MVVPSLQISLYGAPFCMKVPVARKMCVPRVHQVYIHAAGGAQIGEKTPPLNMLFVIIYVLLVLTAQGYNNFCHEAFSCEPM